MRVIKVEGLSLDTLTPALSPAGRVCFYDTLLGEREGSVPVKTGDLQMPCKGL